MIKLIDFSNVNKKNKENKFNKCTNNLISINSNFNDDLQINNINLSKILDPLYIKKLVLEYEFYNIDCELLIKENNKSTIKFIFNKYYSALNNDNILLINK